jgi:DNA-binding winged helix-turn-helix (wHTH) protein/tetratricopeptide (TPR) repeat protein
MKRFPPFRLDTVNQCLWRLADTGREERVLLAPKAFAVLTYLVEHAGRLVSHDELLEAVWPDLVVESQAVKKHVLAVRSALGDRPKHPLFIETVTRRGYRFIATVSESAAPSPIASGKKIQGSLVGRGRALAELHEAWQHALSAEGQVVVITGEAGIGKTALAEEFSRQVAMDEASIRIGHGQCLEGYGTREPYGPVLDALGELCRGPRAEPIVQILSAQAPTWLAQMPALLTREHRDMLQREILGATRERMLREIGDALDSITAQTPLLLILEDLHWVDDSTVDLISALARRRTPAKLMLLATSRPLHAEASAVPLQALIGDLLAHRLCREIGLTLLSEDEVEEHLAAQSLTSPLPRGLAALVHRHTEGNPLFMVAALEHMAKRGLLTHADGRWQLQIGLEQIDCEVPDDLRHMIEAQLQRLSAQEQRALELASIAGVSFCPTLLTVAAETDARSLEDLYEDLSRRQSVVNWTDTASLPDGNASERYEFVHALYRQVLYGRQLPGRRAKLHRQIAEHMASVYAHRLEEVVPELAYHFEQAAEWPRAIEYLQRAAQIAGHRHAYTQADSMLVRALELARSLPEQQRAQTELQLLGTLAAQRSAAFDLRAIETLETLAARAAAYGLIDAQARALLDQSFLLSLIGADRCLEVVEHALRVSTEQSPAMRTRTRTACAFRRLSVTGWNTQDAREFREGLADLHNNYHSPALATELIEDGFIHWVSGEYRAAWRLALEARAKLLEPAASANVSIEYETANSLGAHALLFLGDWGELLDELSTAISWGQKNANYLYIAWALVQKAWLHLNALDFAGARALCESALRPDLTPPADAAWTPGAIGRVRSTGLIFAGSASASLGHYERALEDFSTAKSDLDHQGRMLDWYWRMPLAAGMTELWLAQGDLVRARPEAERFLELSLATAERTWQGLAWEINARIAMKEGDHVRARDCIGHAISTVHGFEVPLATWRVHATAAHIEEELGASESARSHRELSRATILRLADSLPEKEPLRNSFLSAPAVARVLKSNS